MSHDSDKTPATRPAVDETEEFRKARIADLNAGVITRETLEAQYGQVWDTSELTEDFDVSGFMAPYVVVVRKSDNQKGTLEFTHSPRYYMSFEPAT
jgi:hypothetical protein